MTRESESDGLEHLPGAYVAWRASVLGRVTDALEQELILDLIGPPSGLRMLEVGCGDGDLAVELAVRGASVVGSEFLAEPLRAEVHWTHAPNAELAGGDCDLENARRYLEGWSE